MCILEHLFEELYLTRIPFGQILVERSCVLKQLLHLSHK